MKNSQPSTSRLYDPWLRRIRTYLAEINHEISLYGQKSEPVQDQYLKSLVLCTISALFFGLMVISTFGTFMYLYQNSRPWPPALIRWAGLATSTLIVALGYFLIKGYLIHTSLGINRLFFATSLISSIFCAIIFGCVTLVVGNQFIESHSGVFALSIVIFESLSLSFSAAAQETYDDITEIEPPENDPKSVSCGQDNQNDQNSQNG